MTSEHDRLTGTSGHPYGKAMPPDIRFPGDDAVLDYLVTQTDEHFRKQRERGSATATPPGRQQFDALLRICFAASIEREEGRRVEFTLFFDVDALYADYLFATNVELSPRSLARLSA